MRVSTVRTSIAALTLFAMPAKARSADAWQIGSAPSFSSGTYGTDVRTGVFQTPINVRRLFADGDLTVQFPFLCVSGTGVTIVGGTPVPSQSSDAPQRPASDAGRDLRQGAAARTQPARTATTCGIGDIEVRGRYYFVDEGGWRPTVAVRGHFKAPTASEERGLGTGEPDTGFGIELTRSLGGDFMAMVDAGYTVIGDPPGLDYNNNWWYELGFGRDFAEGMVNVSAFLAAGRTIVTDLPDARDVVLVGSLKGSGGWRFQVAGQFGLSDGAPDHGITVSASRRF